ncbi:Uncharacterised protein [Bergeriella denitrificans]|uniref:Uncharacterized protein n=1 Tax=Bergeriella denitrificans TaxID=494 RepID=A0A378UI12_BERDE|nr:Uncharacterised protein [Bergeriella denitrificans]
MHFLHIAFSDTPVSNKSFRIKGVYRHSKPCRIQGYPTYALLTLLVAESDPKQKDTLIRLMMHMLQASV